MYSSRNNYLCNLIDNYNFDGIDEFEVAEERATLFGENFGAEILSYELGRHRFLIGPHLIESKLKDSKLSWRTVPVTFRRGLQRNHSQYDPAFPQRNLG